MSTTHEYKTPTRSPGVLTNNDKIDLFCKKKFNNGAALLIDAVLAISMIFS